MSLTASPAKDRARLVCTALEITTLVESICGQPPLEVRLNSLVPKATQSNKFFVRLNSIKSAGLLRLELNGRYLKEYKALINVTFFASNALKVHLQGKKKPVDSEAKYKSFHFEQE
jgi:hypothetical protein